jgi:hypothetical protein
MSKNDFKEYVCRPYCMFYKEGQKEEMACRGAEVLETLALQKYISPEELPRFEKESHLWGRYRAILGKYVCAQCPFRGNDCDFMSEASGSAHDAGIEPCGGFILLVLLIENDFIDMSSLELAL